MSVAFQLERITLATTHTEKMVTFYNQVFQAELKGIDAYGSRLFTGHLAGIKFLLCPNSIAGVDANQNRHQFRFVVPDLVAVLKQAEKYGGTLEGHVLNEDNEKIAAIRDPDGNTIEVVQYM